MQNPCACEEMCKKGVSDSCKYAISYAVYVPGTTLYTMYRVYHMHGYETYSVKCVYTHTQYIYTYIYCVHMYAQCLLVLITAVI